MRSNSDYRCEKFAHKIILKTIRLSDKIEIFYAFSSTFRMSGTDLKQS